MSETYSPAGNVSAQTFKRATVGEAATGTFGDEFMRQDNTQIADRIRFLDDNGFPNVSKIMFPATQVPSAGANDLDDYEEGTFTPSIKFGGAAVGVTYSTQSGTYTKIGRQVTCHIAITLTSKGSSVGAVTLAGLPFTPATPGVAACGFYSALTSAGMILGYVDSLGTVINVYFAAATGVTALADTNVGNTTTLYFSVTYNT